MKRDAELEVSGAISNVRYGNTKAGKSYLSFRIGVPYGKDNAVEWVNNEFTFWNQSADFWSDKLSDGTEVVVRGTPSGVNRWTSDAGKEYITYQYFANKLIVVGGGSNGSESYETVEAEPTVEETEEVPF